MVNYPVTTFYVKNESEKPVSFKTSVIKYSSIGPYEMTLPFIVAPNDSVLARRTNYYFDALPNEWFSNFDVFPNDSVDFNDPNKSENWIKSLDEKGRVVYIFTLAK